VIDGKFDENGERMVGMRAHENQVVAARVAGPPDRDVMVCTEVSAIPARSLSAIRVKIV
jgi:hypothetical protein